MHRRLFLSALAAPMAAQRNDQYDPVLQAGVYVWTQHYSRLGQRAQDHIADICAAFARAGYRDVELMSLFFRPELERLTCSALARHGLQSSAVYNGGPMHTPEAARETVSATVDLARHLLANIPLRAVVVNPDPLGRPKTDEELRIQADALGQLGWALEREGVTLLLHQHAPEMAGNAREWRYMLAQTEPRYLRVCLDTHWVLRGGLDVMTLLEESGRRLASLHLRNSVQGVWSEDLADGDIDYRAVARYLRSISYDGFLSVELAWDKETRITRPLEDSLRRSREYAESVFDLQGRIH